MSYGYNSGGVLLYGTNDPLPRGLSRTYEQQIARPSQMIALADGIPVYRKSGYDLTIDGKAKRIFRQGMPTGRWRTGIKGSTTVQNSSDIFQDLIGAIWDHGR